MYHSVLSHGNFHSEFELNSILNCAMAIASNLTGNHYISHDTMDATLNWMFLNAVPSNIRLRGYKNSTDLGNFLPIE